MVSYWTAIPREQVYVYTNALQNHTIVTNLRAKQKRTLMKITMLDRIVMALVISTLSAAGMTLPANAQEETKEQKRTQQEQK